MKREKRIISLNMAAWNWHLSDEPWKERLNRTCDYLSKSDPMIIGLQEVQLSGGKYLDILKKRFPDYHIVLPVGYRYKDHPKSVLSILLLSKEYIATYSIASLAKLPDSLRYNLVRVNTTDGFCFRVLNTNVPHTCYDKHAEWFKESRRCLRETFLDEIQFLADRNADENFIALGDFNTVPDNSFIENLAYAYINRPMVDPVLPADKNRATWKNNRLDYILYSRGMLCADMSVKRTRIDNFTITQKLSDHAALIGGVVY